MSSRVAARRREGFAPARQRQTRRGSRVRRPDPPHGTAGVRDGAGLGTVLLMAGLGLLAGAALAKRSPKPVAPDPSRRNLRRGAAILAGSVMADSAIEHFQGSYHNPAMYVGPTAAAATMIATLGKGDRSDGALAVRGVQGAATLIGIVGLGFHSYNILKRPGGLSWNNLFYAAPIGAPGALALAGVLGLSGGRLAEPVAPGDGRTLGGIVGASLLVTTAEIALLHFRGAFHNPAMFVPVVIPPAAGAALCAASLRPARRRHPLTRALLRLTALLGPVGTAFHAFGVSREMGGWANWRQSLLSGPPMPAPASLTGLALAGLASLREIEGGGDG